MESYIPDNVQKIQQQVGKRGRPYWKGLHAQIPIEQKEALYRMMAFEPHALQHDIASDRTRHKVLCCGRRWGKSKWSASEALIYAALGGWVWVVAPNYDLADIIFEDAAMIAESSDYARLLDGAIRMAKGQQRLKTVTGGRIYAKSSEKPNSLLGRGLDLIIFDEASKEKNAMVWPQYLSPTLSDRLGGSIVISTPTGNDWFKDRWMLGDPSNPEKNKNVRSWQYESRTNPYFDIGEWDQQKTLLPERIFDQEYRAVFLLDAGGVFRNLARMADVEPMKDTYVEGLSGVIGEPPDPKRRGNYVMGVDLAQYNDWTVIVVFDAARRKMVYYERFNKIDWEFQKERIIKVGRKWGASLCVDATGLGDPVVSGLQASGYPFEIHPFKISGNTVKAQLIHTLSLAIEQNECHILNDNVMLDEFASYQYERTASGMLTMNAPAGKHDDIVVASALGWYLVQLFGGTSLGTIVLDPRRSRNA